MITSFLLQKQYIFIHDTLKVIIDKKIKSMQDDNNIYMNTGDDNIYANTNPAFGKQMIVVNLMVANSAFSCRVMFSDKAFVRY